MDTEVLYILIAVAGLLGAGIGWLGKQYWYHRKVRRQATGDAEAILLNKKELLEAMLTKEKDTEQKIHLTRQIEVTDFQLLDLYERSYSRTLQDADLPPLETLMADGRQKLNPKQIDEIDNISNKLDALQPSVSVEDLGFLASAYFYSGRYQKAKNTFDKILSLKPNDLFALNNRATTHIRLGNRKEAVDDINNAIKLFPNNWYSFYNRGIALTQQGRYKEALADYNHALKLRPNEPSVLNNRGTIYLKLKKPGKALVDFNRVLKLRPKDPYIFGNRGATYSLLDRNNEALIDYNSFLQIKPNDPEALYNRGAIHAELQNYKEALSDFKRSLLLKPIAIKLYSIACVQSILGQTDDAISNLEKAINLDSKYREMAKTDKDFDNIRDDPRFKKLIELDK